MASIGQGVADATPYKRCALVLRLVEITPQQAHLAEGKERDGRRCAARANGLIENLAEVAVSFLEPALGGGHPTGYQSRPYLNIMALCCARQVARVFEQHPRTPRIASFDGTTPGSDYTGLADGRSRSCRSINATISTYVNSRGGHLHTQLSLRRGDRATAWS